MKRQFHSFFAGMITTVLIAALALSVMAITGKTTIDVYPIDIMVNGEVFQPTNAQGKPVDVFTYKGTTYAPLRALAKAYGLEVGYDAEKKLATVSEPQPTPTPDTTAKPDYSDWSAEDEAAYQEFKGMWDIEYNEAISNFGMGKREAYDLTYTGDFTVDEVRDAIRVARAKGFLERLASELQTRSLSVYYQFWGPDRSGDTVTVYDYYPSSFDR